MLFNKVGLPIGLQIQLKFASGIPQVLVSSNAHITKENAFTVSVLTTNMNGIYLNHTAHVTQSENSY